ncbi:MAG: DUF2344 domain-containing protein, partial [Lachnospiraceae bacterium]|nr:DUF2344 domain-containing protein [Lachnospiraceae bacterium]
IPAKYTEGFHPHQIMSFAYPLGVAMETDGDYMDLELTEDVSPQALSDALNAVMQEGIRICGVARLPEKAPNAMASVAAADYEIHVGGAHPETLREILMTAAVSIINEEVLLLGKPQEEATSSADHRKKGGKKEKKAKDIRPGILSLSVDEIDPVLRMKLLSGSALNVRPADVFSLLAERVPEEKLCAERIIRKEIYGEQDGNYIPLLAMGAEA